MLLDLGFAFLAQQRQEDVLLRATGEVDGGMDRSVREGDGIFGEHVEEGLEVAEEDVVLCLERGSVMGRVTHVSKKHRHHRQAAIRRGRGQLRCYVLRRQRIALDYVGLEALNTVGELVETLTRLLDGLDLVVGET